jgi:hypothetical protein
VPAHHKALLGPVGLNDDKPSLTWQALPTMMHFLSHSIRIVVRRKDPRNTVGNQCAPPQMARF